MRPFIWDQPGRTIPGVPMDPFGLGALGSVMSLSPLSPGIAVSPPHPACHGGEGCRPSSLPAPARTGRAAARAWLPVPGKRCHSLPLMAVPSWGRAGSGEAAQPDQGDPAPSAPLCDCWGHWWQCWAEWGPHGSHRSQGHLLSPRVSSGETKGGSGWATLFPLCRELLYKGSSDIIH